MYAKTSPATRRRASSAADRIVLALERSAKDAGYLRKVFFEKLVNLRRHAKITRPCIIVGSDVVDYA